MNARHYTLPGSYHRCNPFFIKHYPNSSDDILRGKAPPENMDRVREKAELMRATLEKMDGNLNLFESVND